MSKFDGVTEEDTLLLADAEAETLADAEIEADELLLADAEAEALTEADTEPDLVPVTTAECEAVTERDTEASFDADIVTVSVRTSQARSANVILSGHTPFNEHFTLSI